MMTLDFKPYAGSNFKIVLKITLLLLCSPGLFAQGVKYNGNLSPAEGLIKPQEKPYRDEICLNGRWDFQPVQIPAGWISGNGIAPELAMPQPDQWDHTQIKIPSPWNVNEWGGGSQVGQGTSSPYAPGSVYFPSYPAGWAKARMGWLKRNFTVPQNWTGKRIIVHFEAVAGDCVVYVNGKQAGKHFDAYLPFDVDITDLLKPAGENELLVGIRHRKLFDKKSKQYKYFNATYPPGSNTGDLIGIWQDVFLQALPAVRVDSIFAKPFVANDELQFDVKLVNQTQKRQQVTLAGDVKEWLNKAMQNGRPTAEIEWELGKTVLGISSSPMMIEAGQTKTITLTVKVGNRLKLWSPATPNLYTLVLNTRSGGKIMDTKTERFGWRSFTIQGKNFYLNGQPIKCYGDLQHPFGPYICSRRFAWAWYSMIKDAGGNAVRPHAQPWPRVYYDLADEMGLMVLDETALFGSSISLNMDDDSLWTRTADQLEHLILRDRNHPSVVGWSIGNELFAIALLNKPTPEVADRWNDRIINLAKIPPLLDSTREFITADGDQDMSGHLPVWSKHFGHGLRLNQLPNVDKPMVVGESGATYYGKPRELFPFIGMKAYGTYEQRNEALAIDVYQNVVKMARPLLGWFSPSELCWFGIEHLNLGYHDYSRLPGMQDGIFPAQPYVEGQPGYQFERIPPYVTTFNPGLDPELPLYKPLAMFYAFQSAVTPKEPQASKWDHFQDTSTVKPALPQLSYKQAAFIGNQDSRLKKLIDTIGVKSSSANQKNNLLVIDADDLPEDEWTQNKQQVEQILKNGGLIWIALKEHQPAEFLKQLIRYPVQLISRPATALQNNEENAIGKYFDLRKLYFSEMDGDRNILKMGLSGEIVNHSSIVFKPANTDWALFNGVAENRKCAQIVLYEHLLKPDAAAMVSYRVNNAMIVLSSLDFTIINQTTVGFWRQVCAALGIETKTMTSIKDSSNKKHDLLLDGPVNH